MEGQNGRREVTRARLLAHSPDEHLVAAVDAVEDADRDRMFTSADASAELFAQQEQPPASVTSSKSPL
jgi:hypothetical protein